MGQIKYAPKIGNRYGQWEVISTEIKRHSEKKQRAAYFKVKCNCGREGWRAAHTLASGTTKACKSCCKTVNNLNTYLERYFKHVKQRALDKNFEIDIDCNYLQELWDKQESKCALSGLPIDLRANWQTTLQTASLDRIDNTKGYIKGNVQWLHKDVNNMKYTFTEEYFVDLCKRIGSSKCG